MAKSKSGGTRSYIRGRVGADVYSIGKTASGSKQQVVRSLAESVANPQTLSQMVQRMLMTTVSEACKVLKPIIDHSFDGVPDGQPAISEFMKRNLPLLKAFYENGAESGYQYALNEYQERAGLCGAYIVSSGKKRFPEGEGDVWHFYPGTSDVMCECVVNVPVKDNKQTFGDFAKCWPLGRDGYLTIVGIQATGAHKSRFVYYQLKLRSDVADDYVMCSWDAESGERTFKCNIEDVFEVETNMNLMAYIYGAYSDPEDETSLGPKFDGNQDTEAQGGCYALIGSWKTKAGWEHNTARLDCDLANTAHYRNNSNVINTYPIGTQRFLNGGDL